MSLSYVVKGICQQLRLFRSMLRCKPSQRQGCLTDGFDWIPTWGWQTKGVAGSAPGPGSILQMLGFDGREGWPMVWAGPEFAGTQSWAEIRKASAEIFWMPNFLPEKRPWTNSEFPESVRGQILNFRNASVDKF